MKKTGKCPNCCPEGGAIFESGMAYDDNEPDPVPVWRCNNCFHEIRRVIRKRLEGSSPLTQSQLDAITRIQQDRLLGQGTGYEVKEFRLTNLGRCVSVVVTVGRKGDEGTMAAVLCRYRGHFFVGRRGGIEAVSPSEGNASKAQQYPLIYGWRS